MAYINARRCIRMRRFVEPYRGREEGQGAGWGEGGVRVGGGVGVEGGGGVGSGGVEIEKVSRMQPKHENVSATRMPPLVPGPVRRAMVHLTEGRGWRRVKNNSTTSILPRSK